MWAMSEIAGSFVQPPSVDCALMSTGAPHIGHEFDVGVDDCRQYGQV